MPVRDMPAVLKEEHIVYALFFLAFFKHNSFLHIRYVNLLQTYQKKERNSIMKFKTNFKDLREAVVTIGKAVKKNMSPIEISLVKIEAGEDYVELSTNGSIGACVKIQAVVEEAGSFVTSFSGINILSVRKCDGDINASNEVNENTLVLKYRGGKAKTELAAVDKVFNSVAKPADDCANVSLPYASLKSMCKDTVFAAAADDNVASDLHAIKVNIMDDTDGLLKFTLAACDGKSIAVRTAYAVKEGAYTGEILILPDVFKISLEILETDDENVKISIGNGKLFMETENARTCFPVLDKNYPDLNRILSAKKCSFTASIKKNELIEALNCASYLQQEQKASSGTEGFVSFKFKENAVTVGFTGMSQYAEVLDAVTTGELPEQNVLFKTSLIKEIVALYPNNDVVIGGTTEKNPFWLCCGEHDEYLYCAMPCRLRE